jgi:hypothetical protein
MEKKSSVRKLINSIELFWDAYADNLNRIAKGEEVKYPIEDKTVDTVLKMTKEMTSFEQFEKIANPDAVKIALEAPKKVDNIYEHVVKQVKNGHSKI